MSYSHHSKVLVQIGKKPGKVLKWKKYNVPKVRKTGINNKRCRRCGRTRAHIDKYGLNLCRQCFRDIATNIGFKKYS
jgi:small subunit ribosomal protein S14